MVHLYYQYPIAIGRISADTGGVARIRNRLCKKVVVNSFGDTDQLEVVDLPDPEPSSGEVVVRLTSIGMNNADLMARRGEYQVDFGQPAVYARLRRGGGAASSPQLGQE